jgi:hypothetical protein
MNQYYLNRHERQIVRFEGLDLAGDRRREILVSARNISRGSILQFNHTQFHVASQSRSGTFHSIDLNLMMCDCQDFPRIRFCKHIAAIHLHFPHLEQSDPIITWKGDPDPNSDSDSVRLPRVFMVRLERVRVCDSNGRLFVQVAASWT